MDNVMNVNNKKKSKGLIFDIRRFSIHDGPGIRTTVFFKGCPLKCRWCHNPESQRAFPETFKNKTIGEEKTVADIVKEIEKETIFYDESRGGVTFSGGEPLEQPHFLEALLDECKKKEIHTTLDTSGDSHPSIFNPIIDKVDLFLFDLKIMDEKEHKKYTGVSNHFILQNLKTLAKKKKNVIIRFPVIPTITDTDENIKSIASFVMSLKNIHEIDLLPYHRTGETKYRHLGFEYNMEGITPPDDNRMEEIKHLFEQNTQNIEIKRI